ncbi:hypothetical protein [Actinoplanes subglobosus]|uniref:Uncharacterized protein n=1 Tax=Actinoplanes subglobosus TaxID=1547892 RepID=A0ABV8IRJ2_9ACTN
MLEGLGDIDWSAFDGAYGPCAEAPGILRAVADPDPEAAGEGWFEFCSSIWHQGTVYPVTVRAVPFLIELAVTDGVHRRDRLLHALGSLTDPDRCDGPDLPAVREAIVAGSAALRPPIGDPDPAVRAAAAYALGRCGDLGPLQDRWGTEQDPAVRAALLLALHHNGAAGEGLLRAASAESGPVPAAVALAYSKGALALPRAIVTAAAASFAACKEWQTPWSRQAVLDEVFERLDAESVDALAAALQDTDRRGREMLGHALLIRFQASRSAPAVLMPRIRALLTDPDAAVVEAAVTATAHAGTAASEVADLLAHIAAGPGVSASVAVDPAVVARVVVDSGKPGSVAADPGVSARVAADPGELVRVAPESGEMFRDASGAGGPDRNAARAGEMVRDAAGAGEPDRDRDPAGLRRGAGDLPVYPEPAATALVTLVRLRDRRSRDPVLAAWAAGFRTAADDPLGAGYGPEFDPVVLAALRRRITAMIAAGARRPLVDAVAMLEGWGPRAAPAVPELIAALPVVDAPASRVLAAIGPAAHQALPALRQVGGTRAGHAVWQLTGDSETLLAATADLLGSRRLSAYELGFAADLGVGAGPLVPLLRTAIAHEPANIPEAEVRLAAARLLWGATGDAGEVLPIVEAALRGDHLRDFETSPDWTDPAVRNAAALAADLAPAGERLQPLLRSVLHDRLACVPAARALWRHGADPAGLVAPLLDGVAGGAGSQALDLLVEMKATSAVSRLTELADSDERSDATGLWDDIVWADERFQRESRAAVIRIRTGVSSDTFRE